jgi:hypothetical protein
MTNINQNSIFFKERLNKVSHISSPDCKNQKLKQIAPIAGIKALHFQKPKRDIQNFFEESTLHNSKMKIIQHKNCNERTMDGSATKIFIP